MDTPVTENVKSKNIQAQNMQEIWNTMKKPKLQIIRIEEGEETQFKGTKSVFFFNKIEEKEEMQITRQITPNRPDQKRSSP